MMKVHNDYVFHHDGTATYHITIISLRLSNLGSGTIENNICSFLVPILLNNVGNPGFFRNVVVESNICVKFIPFGESCHKKKARKIHRQLNKPYKLTKYYFFGSRSLLKTWCHF